MAHGAVAASAGRDVPACQTAGGGCLGCADQPSAGRLSGVIKLVYKPFAIIAGFISKRLSRTLFQTAWARIDQEPPPVPGTGEKSTAMVVGAQALQGAISSGTAAAVNRTMARFFHHLVGAWPEKPAAKDDV